MYEETENRDEPVFARIMPSQPMHFVEWQTWPFEKKFKRPTVSNQGIIERDQFEDIRELLVYYGFTVFHRDVDVEL